LSPAPSIGTVSEQLEGSSAPVVVRSTTTKALVAVIHTYQSARAGRPTGCRFVPSCSEYAIEALDVHGPVRGSVLAVRRLARCTPWGGHGIDPVPDRSAP